MPARRFTTDPHWTIYPDRVTLPSQHSTPTPADASGRGHLAGSWAMPPDAGGGGVWGQAWQLPTTGRGQGKPRLPSPMPQDPLDAPPGRHHQAGSCAYKTDLWH